MRKSRVWATCTVAGVLQMLAGCESTMGEPQGAETPASMAERHLLSSLSLSGTHKIEFWEYESGDVLVDEKLNVDRDLADGHPTLAGMKGDGQKLTVVYERLAGKAFDAAASEKLRQADERVALRLAQAGVDTTALPTQAVVTQSQIGVVPGTTMTPVDPKRIDGNIETVTSATACAEPAWDWQGDVGWFKNNFCLSDSKFCPTEVTWASYGWYRGPHWFRATGFAQSHCSSAYWLFERKNYGGFPSYGIALFTLIETHLAPRTLNTQSWTTTGDRSWHAYVSSDTGSNRVALSIHHE